MNHTPGPWTIHNPSSPKQAAVIAREIPGSSRRTVVAVIPDHLEFGTASVTDWNEQEANARLVAAAPDMLTTLQSILNIALLMQQRDGGPWAKTIEHEARQALTKAGA